METVEDSKLRISEVARQLGVSAQYLRLLEGEGRIPPARRIFGYRCFTETDVHRLREMGVGSGERLKPYKEKVGHG